MGTHGFDAECGGDAGVEGVCPCTGFSGIFYKHFESVRECVGLSGVDEVASDSVLNYLRNTADSTRYDW